MAWWGLAFPPFPGEQPEWLAAVQAVCFGNLPGELPAPYGWGALIVSPLAMLAALVVGWGGEMGKAGRHAISAHGSGRRWYWPPRL